MLRIRSAYGSRVANLSIYRNFSSTLKNAKAVTKELDPKVYKSHVKTKLNYFLETGQILKYSPNQYQKRISKIKEKLSYKINLGSYSLQKALLVLRSKYDNILQTDSGEIISTEKLTPSDLNIDSQKSLSIFKALVNIKKINRKSLDEKLILKLLGTNTTQLNDPFLVTRDVLKLLERDREISRAVYLAKLAGSESGVVGMNAVLQWLLERGDTKAAFRNFQDRKKWGIPITEHTYTIFFDGLAKAHEWGKVSDDMAEKCMQIFESFKESSSTKAKQSNELKADKRSKCTIIHFNSCLSLLLKNFKNGQQYAWTFFDLLLPGNNGSSSALIADSQTFTIFLNGIKKYSQHNSELIINNDNLTKQVKTLRLLQIQGKLIQIAELILGKITAAATPPVPPTKEEVEENPDCLITYRQKMKRRLVDIDQTFVSVFVSCFINNSAGTGLDINSGSHYKYIQSGLKYLSIWCPEVQSLFHFVEKASKDNDYVLLKPSDTLKIGTDSRLKNAIDFCEKSDLKFLEEGVVVDDILPQSIITPEQLEPSKINPLVIFPPPLLSHNKTKAIFSGKQKRLVDFTRPTFEDIRSILLDKQYKTSRGKFGKKLPQSSNVTLNKKNGINKFILMQTLDGLLQLGKSKEFYLAIWYCLTKWGGIYVSRTDILKVANDIGVSKGVLSEDYFPHYIYPKKTDVSDKNTLDDVSSNKSFIDITPQKKLELTPEHEAETVDIMLIENFIFKVSKSFNRDAPSNLATEIFASLVNPSTNISKTLSPRPKTIDSIFSVFMKQLHHYNDSNYNRQFLEKRQKNIPNNTPKKSITGSQLQLILPSLIKFMDCLMVHETRGQRKKSIVSNDYVESYNRIIERLYRSTWSEVENSDELTYHKMIIKSGILLYRPRNLIDRREKIVYSEPILKSMEIVYEALKNSQSLDRKDVKLMLSLKLIFQLKSTDEAALDKLDSYASACYLSIH
ncbi:PPR repeat-containing protein [Debaryomyces fabryi]|uniref:Mitochondrial 15S rRNA processing factor CCM1 n=1 Tax=Debaryomyces fabryi TaxID=58627 RepID=A0A0V1PZL8_9ASCO|nr:PPR repeat-containing protein [Debaryomyces fabryi]KSA01691.1 PPR repeat-containing protein [Debaryomyces fabryi]CUM55549.1 unnamed protein product [Debaryomyces fabryi]